MARPAAGIGPRKPVSRPPTWRDSIHGTEPFDPIGYLSPWTAPPPGTFSPGIKYEVEKSRRGLGQLLEDEEKKLEREEHNVAQKNRETERARRQRIGDIRREEGYAKTDEGHELEDLGRGHGRKLEGLGINFARDIEDLSVARQRGEQDYERTLTDLQHRYGSAAEQQAQAQIQQGTNEGGTEAASTAVRGANQAYDKSGIDTSHTRGTEDLSRREQRDREDYGRAVGQENEDFGTNTGRIGEGLTRHLAAYAINANRANQAARTTRNATDRAFSQFEEESGKKTSRAKEEQAAYERAQSEAAFYEAHQLHPKIQFPGSTPSGVPHVPAPHVASAAPVGGGPGTKTPLGWGGWQGKARPARAAY